MSWQNVHGKKPAAGGASFLQKALEGAVVSALGLAEFSSQGASSGKAQGKGGAPDAAKKQFCSWKGCKAAEAKKPTIGDKYECFSCGRHFRISPPIQKVVDWAFEEKILAEKNKAAAPSSKGKGKDKSKEPAKGSGKGQASAPPPARQASQASDEEALRKARLEQLRAAKANAATPPDGEEQSANGASRGTEDLTITEEINAAWNLDGAEDEKALRLDPQLANELQEWDLQPMFDSLKHDKLPAVSTLKTAEAVVASILSESKPCTGAAAAVKLAAEHEALKKTLVHYEAEGLEDLKAEAEAKLKTIADKIEKSRSPTTELQRKDVVAVKAQFIKDAQARTETAREGKRKAADRSATRVTTVQNTIKMYQRLETALTARDTAIGAAHTKKAAAIEARDKQVCALFDQKTEQLAAVEAAAKNAAGAAALAATAAAASAAASAAATPAADPALQQAMLDLQRAQKQQAELMATIQKLQSEAAKAEQKQQRQRAAADEAAEKAMLEADALLAATLDSVSDADWLAAAKVGTTASTPQVELSQAVALQHRRTVMYTSDELPELTAFPGEVYGRVMLLTATNLTAWAQAGSMPITYVELLSGIGSHAQVNLALGMLADIAGATIWDRFHDSGSPSYDDYVPLQMATILMESLRRADQQLATLRQTLSFTEKAKERFLELHNADVHNKKSRSGPYS